MDKKRRDIENCGILDLAQLNQTFVECISKKKQSSIDEGVFYKEFCLLPKFGEGNIIEITFEGVEIAIYRYTLSKDYLVYFKGVEDAIKLSFLLEGEKIASMNEAAEDILYENQESYMVSLDSYKGAVKISGNKPLNEIQIKMTREFLYKQGLPEDFNFKKFTDDSLIIPITDELLSILNNLQNITLKGLSRKIFLEAKVLELLAFQIDNYKKFKIDFVEDYKDKTIKKLYLLKQFLKDNLHDNFSLKQLSREFLLNEQVLKNDFKRVFGKTVSEYFFNEKMIKAKELLRSTQIPVYEVAEEIGYKNATHFSAAFKRSFGVTPKKYRSIL
ncbi:AraC-like DNA-binding protein [Tenacibaculum adriaticum]|uniref:AraC-like DNA-binding protein n=1 Tax=Tenacibaculum adriaticum TaxID=413713 RepID=A0A5S5DQI6_9FLAO|nr:AraC family transcriptional regulator [Tenacibaculum adriaticum]TYP98147.1 AraC-like DNA-binding protein [Tenacibaculum adriaticum]